MGIFGDWKRLLVGGSAAAAIIAGSMTALARAGGEPDTTATAQESVDAEEHELEECVSEEWEPTAEEIAWIKAENDALKMAFDEAGVAYSVELDEEIDVEFVEWDHDDDRANEVAEEALTEFRHVVEAAELQAENDALRKAFDAEAIAYELVLDQDIGVWFVQWDFDDDRANEVAEGVFDDLYGDMELGDEEKAEINAETEALADAFDAAGISYMVFHDNEQGVRFIDWDDDEFANEVAEQVFAKLYGDEPHEDCLDEMDEPSEEYLAQWQAVGDELAERLEAEGIAFEIVEDAFGVRFPEWDEADDERAFAILDEVSGDLFDDAECDDEFEEGEDAA